MEQPQRWIITSRWLKIKEMYEKGTNGSKEFGTNFPIGGELDKLVYKFIEDLGTLTLKFGWDCVIEEVKMDLWKERIWSLASNAGLMYNSTWRNENEEIEDEFDENETNPLIDYSVEEDEEPTVKDIYSIEKRIPEFLGNLRVSRSREEFDEDDIYSIEEQSPEFLY